MQQTSAVLEFEPSEGEIQRWQTLFAYSYFEAAEHIKKPEERLFALSSVERSFGACLGQRKRLKDIPEMRTSSGLRLVTSWHLPMVKENMMILLYLKRSLCILSYWKEY